MKISNRLQQLNLPVAPLELRRRVTESLDAEDCRLRAAASNPPVTVSSTTPQWPGALLPRWRLALATLAILLLVVALRERLQHDPPAPSAPQLMDLPRLAELPSTDAHEIKRWLESYVDYPVEVPTIRNASLNGGQVLRSGQANAVAFTYQLRGRPLIYVVMPTSHVMGRQLDAERMDTVTLEGFSAVTWMETGTARVLLAPMPRRDVAAVAEQCRKGPTPK